MRAPRWFWWLLLLMVGALALVCAFHFDSQVHSWIAGHQNRSWKIFMRNVSRFGDWPAHVAVGLVSLGVAYWRGSKKWIRVLVAMLVACAIAGVSTRIIKITAGRARPSVKTEAMWSGPSLSSEYHAFPSGHTASSSAFFATLFLASSRLGLACLPILVLIAASRMYVGAHYLSDVVFAAMLGVLCAFLAARWFFSEIRK